MRLTIDIFTALSCIVSLVGSKESYLYEKQNFFGLGKRIIPKPQPIYINLDAGEEHPKPIPTPATLIQALSSRSLYQGARHPNETRVFRRRFDYEAKTKGQQVHCEGMFSCVITFLAIESTEAIPVILRGGAGHRYFTVIVKSKPGRELKGQIRAYCKKQPTDFIYGRGMHQFRRFKFDQSTTVSAEV